MYENQNAAESSIKQVSSYPSSKFTNLKSSPTSQIHSPLLRLPSELRNMVYAHALGGNIWLIDMGHTKPHIKNVTEHTLALLQVNRQIYAEARLFPYMYNTFAGQHNGHLREWIKSLSFAQRTSITSIKRYQRSYIIESVRGIDVSPIFWMDTPSMNTWELEGLKWITVEVALGMWGFDIGEKQTTAVKENALVKLRGMVEENHPGVSVDVVLRRGH